MQNPLEMPLNRLSVDCHRLSIVEWAAIKIYTIYMYVYMPDVNGIYGHSWSIKLSSHTALFSV